MNHRLPAFVTALSLGLLLAACSSDPLMQPKSATVLPSGVAYIVLQAGTGADHPALTDNVTVNYTLWQPAQPDPNGSSTMVPAKKLEGTIDANGVATPATFPLGKLIKGWQQMIPLMTAGEKVRVWIPSDMAYGDHPTRADHPPAGPLIFEIELISIAH